MKSRIFSGLQRALGGFAARAHQRPLLALALAAALTALGGWPVSRLTLETDLTSLLPRSFESVAGLGELKVKFGGIGYVAVAGHGTDQANLERFADELAPKIQALPGIRFVEHRRASGFFGDRALYYMTVADLEEIEARIRAREKYERRQKNPMYISFENERAPSLDFSDIEARYGEQSARRLAGDGSDYYLSAEERMVILLAKPQENSTDLAYARQVVGQVEALIARQDLSRFGPDFQVQLTGTYKKKVDQQAQIARDLAWASTVALLLLLGYLLLHFRSAIAVGLNLLPVLTALVWTYGLVAATYGSVNLLTGFLAAILGGLGIEHGIHLLGRYEALRREGLDSQDATRAAFAHTGSAATISALVAAVTFLSLAISEFRAFREFGVIAGLGMMVVIAAYLLVLPALLGLCARFGWRPAARPLLAGTSAGLGRLLARARFRRGVVSILGPSLAVLALGHRPGALQLRLRRPRGQQLALLPSRQDNQPRAGVLPDPGGDAHPRRRERARHRRGARPPQAGAGRSVLHRLRRRADRPGPHRASGEAGRDGVHRPGAGPGQARQARARDPRTVRTAAAPGGGPAVRTGGSS